MSALRGAVLVAGRAARGAALVLSAPISFWGGINPKNGQITDVRHPEHGLCIAGRVLCLPGTIGSSSAAAVLLELVYARQAPAALILHEPDAILLLGLIVAREMGYEIPSALRLDREHFAQIRDFFLDISSNGDIHLIENIASFDDKAPVAGRHPAAGDAV